METAYGTLLKRGDGGAPEAFVTIAELSNVNGPITRGEIEGTNHSSPNGWTQWKPGLKSMEITFEGNYLPSDPTHNAATGLLRDINSNLIRNYRIEWANVNVKWTAPAFLRDFDPAAPVEDKIGMSGTFRVAGEPILE